METAHNLLIRTLPYLFIFSISIKAFPQSFNRLSASQNDLKISEKNISGLTGFGDCVSNAGDVNNDGFDDIIVGAYYYNQGTGKAYIYFGGIEPDSIADITLMGEDFQSQFGISISSAGDVNNDGFDDVIVGAQQYNLNTGRAYIYFGSGTMDSIPDVIIEGEGGLGNSVSSAGDVNNDGFDDVIVGAAYYNHDTGRAYIYLGGKVMDNVVDIILENKGKYNRYGQSVSSAGDVNNDGFDDVIVGAPGYNSLTGRTYIYFGSGTMDSIADVIFDGESINNNFGSQVSSVGDLNNDGFDDIVVGAERYNDRCKGYIYYGGSIMDNNPDIIFLGGEEMEVPSGFNLSSAGDINNDGYDDFMVGIISYQKKYCNLYFGGELMDSIPDITIEVGIIENYGEFGSSVSSAGDINNDGFDDFIIGGSTSLTGRVDIFYGAYTPNTIADIILMGESRGNDFGYSVSSDGDINNDGFDDVIVGAPGYCGNKGRCYIYFGGCTRDNKTDIILNGESSEDFFGYSVASAGDVNNDGFDDVIIGARRINTGKAYIYFGGETMDTVADIILMGEETRNQYSTSVASAGDVNNDGFDDVIVGDMFYKSLIGRAYIYLGGSNMDTVADVILQGIGTGNSGFGASVSSAGDINKDGFDDILVGAYYFNDLTGRAYVYYGGETMDNIADITMDGEEDHDAFGLYVASSGDINNDGYDDIMVASVGYKSHTGRVYLYYGAKSMDNIADVIFDGESTYNNFGLSMSAGDINNDGFNDLLIGACPGYGTRQKGFAYIFYGGDLLNSIPEKIIEGEELEDSFGTSVSSVGDVNKDGFDDIIIGANTYPVNGAVYLFCGDPFVQQPMNASFCEENKDTVTFSVLVYDEMYYQWQVSSDSGNSFLNIKDGDIYYGSSTANLKVVPNANLLGYQYRCKIKKEVLCKTKKKKQYFFSDAAMLKSFPLPTCILSGGATICQGETTNLSVNFTGSAPWTFRLTNDKEIIDLSTNNSPYTIPVNTSGTYKIVALNDANCTGKDLLGEAAVKINPLPTSILSGDTILCEGDSTELRLNFTGSAPWGFTLSNGTNSKLFTTSDNPLLITIDSAGIYKITALHDANCIGKDFSGESTINISPRPSSLLYGYEDLCLEDSVEICILFTGQSPWSYTLSDGVESKVLISYDNNFTIKVDSTGLYQIINLNDANCVGNEMYGEAVINNCNSLSQIDEEMIKIFPNPTSGKFKITNLLKGTKIIITSISGQTIYYEDVNSNIVDIDLSSSYPGMYLIKIETNNKIQTSKFIIE